MLYLQATQRARNALGLKQACFGPPGETESLLGNWMLNVVPIGGRYAFLFMSTRSLLSFPIMIGKRESTLEDMPTFLEHGLKQLTQTMRIPKDRVSLLLNDLDEIGFLQSGE